MPYLTFAEQKSRSSFSPEEWDEFVGRPGRETTFVDWERGLRSGEIDDRLRLRYAVPFGVAAPETEPDPELVPEIIKTWMVAFLDERLHRVRRYPGEETPADTDLAGDATRARQAIADAADQDRASHPELPLRADRVSESGVAKGRPVTMAFNSVHGFFDYVARQRDEGGW